MSNPDRETAIALLRILPTFVRWFDADLVFAKKSVSVVEGVRKEFLGAVGLPTSSLSLVDIVLEFDYLAHYLTEAVLLSYLPNEFVERAMRKIRDDTLGLVVMAYFKPEVHEVKARFVEESRRRAAAYAALPHEKSLFPAPALWVFGGRIADLLGKPDPDTIRSARAAGEQLFSRLDIASFAKAKV